MNLLSSKRRRNPDIRSHAHLVVGWKKRVSKRQVFFQVARELLFFRGVECGSVLGEHLGQEQTKTKKGW